MARNEHPVTAAGLKKRAVAVAELLRTTRTRLVLAESCTCGLLAALLGEIPGISEWFCGSAVVYQEATKSAWLEIPPSDIAQFGVVSPEVAAAMVAGVLKQTPLATAAASITGHLGPNAPKRLDGVVHVGIGFRDNASSSVRTFRHRLPACAGTPRSIRLRRRRAAAAAVLDHLAVALRQRPTPDCRPNATESRCDL